MRALDQLLSTRDWRLSHIYQLKNELGHVDQFRFRPAQSALYLNMWWANLILKARQLGFSTMIVLFLLDRMLFNESQEMGIIDLTLNDAKKKLDKVAYAYDSIGYGVPGWDLEDRHRLNRHIHDLVRLEAASKTELRFSNGSGIFASVSHRGGSLQGTHVSEYGAIAHHFPTKALELVDGVIPASHGPVFFESTHKGGKFGEHYKLIQKAMANEALPPEELTRRSWKFHFFPWWKMTSYRMPGPYRLTEDAANHFAELERDGIFLDDAQKKWWIANKDVFGLRMGQEYPSRPSDAIEAPIEGAIYGTILANLRSKGKVGVDFEIDQRIPCFVGWDIGWSDYTSLWAVQITPYGFLWLDWYQDHEQPFSHYAEIIREWRKRYPIAGNLLPHDAFAKETSSGLTYVHHLKTAGIDDIIRVDCSPDVWTGIGEMKEILRRSTFHARTCLRRNIAGGEAPSGVDHLEAYRKHQSLSGEVVREMPIHDEHSHTADAARIVGEAHALGLISKYHRARDREDRSNRRQAIFR